MAVLLVLLLSVIGYANISLASTGNIFCYYGSWSVYRSRAGQFQVDDIDPTLCTHIVYASVGIDMRGNVIVMDKEQDITNGGLVKFIRLKQKNPDVKVMISLGGWNEGSKKYSNIVNTPQLRANLVSSLASFLTQYNFDGINIDWQYPGKRGGSPSDRQAFVQFIADLRSRLGRNVILTALVSPLVDYIGIYDVPQLNKVLDYVHVMTNDFRDAYANSAGHTSPLYPGNSNDKLNVYSAVTSWLNAGLSSEKLIIGVAAYGRSYYLSNPSNNRVGAPTSGPGPAGPYTIEPGSLSYLEICEEQIRGGWSKSWNDVQQHPYMYKGSIWVGYDDAKSVSLKAEFTRQQNLGGVFVWSVDQDDGKNICNSGTFPLVRAVKAALKDETGTPNENQCKPNTFKRHETDCSAYYFCVTNGSGVNQYEERRCLYGLYFDINRNLCNIPSAVEC